MLISAPAGYGKSTLAAEWCGADPRAAVWVRLERADNKPAVLLSHLAAALDRIGAVPEGLLEELSCPAPRIKEVALPLLASGLGECAPFLLVLDDLQALTAKKSLAIVAVLAEQVSSSSQLMLVTRCDPKVSIGRLRASGDLAEVRTAQIALDANETRAVAACGGLALTEKSAAALCERTEGWAAAVTLQAHLVRARDTGSPTVTDHAGHQQVAEYLLEEVFEGQDDRLKAFVLGTSILERMTAPLCNALLDIGDAADALGALVRSNAFVVELDDHREWFRYHRLYREFLRAELERRHPERLAVYRGRAARWCEQHGYFDEAFDYACRSGDLGRASKIALRQRTHSLRSGQIERMRRSLDHCADNEIASDAQLSIAAARVYVLAGDGARARRHLAAAERGPLDGASADGASSLSSAVANIRSMIAPDGVGRMLSDAEFVYSTETGNASLLLDACRQKGTASLLLGRPLDAIASFNVALLLSDDKPEFADVRAVSLGYLALAASDLQSQQDLQRWAAEAAGLVASAGLENTLASAVAHTARALAHERHGDSAEAMRQLENVRRVRSLLVALPWLNADLALRCADVAVNLGDLRLAAELTQVASDALRLYPDAGTLPARLRRIDERIRSGQDYGLTHAEVRLLHFLPTHLSLQEIADRLYVARPTIKTQIASIYDKLGVTGRSDAVVIIEQLGLGPTFPDPIALALGRASGIREGVKPRRTRFVKALMPAAGSALLLMDEFQFTNLESDGTLFTVVIYGIGFPEAVSRIRAWMNRRRVGPVMVTDEHSNEELLVLPRRSSETPKRSRTSQPVEH